LDANRVVPVDRLVDRLWAGEPPVSGVATLHAYVSNLRRVLPAGLLVTRSPGYVLAVPDDAIDARRFEALTAAGRRRFAAGDAGGAADDLRDALALWRGEALADVAG